MQFKRSSRYCLASAMISIALFTSCSSHYRLVKSNRTEYKMSKDVAADSIMIKFYAPYKQQMEAEMNSVIGHSAVLMSKVDTVPETLLRNFFSDALFHEALKSDKTIDFAIPSTKGGLRVDIPKGDIKLSNIFEVMPFENEMMVCTLKPEDVENLLNFIAGTGGQPVANLRMKIVGGKPTDVTINGKPWDKTKNYKVLTSDYIAGGGDNVQSFKNSLKTEHVGMRVRDALITYVEETEAAGKMINPKLDGRITKN